MNSFGITMRRSRGALAVLVCAAALVACGGGDGGGTTASTAQPNAPAPAPAPTPPPPPPAPTPPPPAPTPPPGPPPSPPPPPPPTPAPPPPSALDLQLRALIQQAGLTGDPAAGRGLPSIDDPLPRLGKLLFFSKALSGNLDVACASCHHPALGGGDSLAVSIGPATNPNVVGPGRVAGGQGTTGRNSPTFFNAWAYDAVLFWDGRVESLAKSAKANGAGGGIRTPDSAFGVADANAGPNLPAAQMRFPLVAGNEMRGTAFAGLSADEMRRRIAERLGNYGSGVGGLAASQWLDRFRTAFATSGTAEQLITMENVARAIAEYQRSAVFANSPWNRYVKGDNAAISDDAKQGAIFFYRTTAEGGMACAQCHKGDTFTDEKHHAVGFPQAGPGQGDGTRDDFGRARVTGNDAERYRFRTPSLLNVEVTAPFGHAGTYASLTSAIEHYAVPDDTVDTAIRRRSWCSIPPFDADPNCRTDDAAVANTRAALAKMQADRIALPNDSMPVVNLNRVPQSAVPQVEAFIVTLTDPCVKDRACLSRWIPQAAEAPDAHQLNATDSSGRPL